MYRLSRNARSVAMAAVRTTESRSTRISKNVTSRILPVFIALMTVGASVVLAPLAHADSFDSQIQALNQENSQSRAALGGLEAEEASLAAVVANLRSQIAALEAQIRDNQAKRTELNARIAEAEVEMSHQKKILGTNIKRMYLEDQMTTGEMLATSKDLGDFVDKEQYRLTVQAQIKKTVERIDALKKEMEDQRVLIDKLLSDQEVMQATLAAQRAESDRLLALNQNEQAAYEQDIKGNAGKIAELKRQQAVENARSFVGTVNYAGTGSYPWANTPFPNAISDPWGMYKRQCVSYTAWKVASTGRHMPFWGGRGNANNWPSNARAAGIPVDSSPRVGDVAVSMAGYYGHTMYVEEVYGNGTIRISQYNGAWDGRYSEGVRSAAGLVFIHF